MSPRLRNRQRAEALQEALEGYERLLESGRSPAEARAETLETHPADATLFAVASALRDAAIPLETPDFAAAFEMRLRNRRLPRARSGGKMPLVRPKRPSYAALGCAAAVTALAALLVPAFHSLPGDPLYALKTRSEQSRLWLVSGSSAEARVRLGLAGRRLEEVHGLIERVAEGALAPGISAAPLPKRIKDPHIAALIQATLQEASRQIVTAAKILIDRPSDANALDKLVRVSSQGQQIGDQVAADLPHMDRSPVLHTVVTLARIEAKAKAARSSVPAASATPPPCATPTPVPTESPKATSSPTPAPTPMATPAHTSTPEPTQTPTPTPCISPSPKPTPTATVAPAATPRSTPVGTPSSEGVGAAGAGQGYEGMAPPPTNAPPPGK